MTNEEKPVTKKTNRFAVWCLRLFFLGFICLLFAGGAIIYILRHYSNDLPDHTHLAEYQPLTVSRLYASDGKLLAEYAHEKRLFVPIKAMPKLLTDAFIAAEDKNFYHHSGIDYKSIVRAAITNVMNYGKNRPLVGGSTITQQVVKNFLLTNEQSFERKIKEALLAYRISKAFSKDRILELYLNEIYLGARSYGVAAASLNYFNKSIDELELEEAALLAGLPKAPSSYDPRKFPEKGLIRRNYVLKRMLETGYITKAQYDHALQKDIVLTQKDNIEITKADYFAETVRRQIIREYGEKKLYREGLSILTTLVPELQEHAHDSLRKGLEEYDKRHGWRGPITNFKLPKNTNNELLPIWLTKLRTVKKPVEANHLRMAIVKDFYEDGAHIGIENGTLSSIPFKNMKWARKWVGANEMGPRVKKAQDVLKRGDVILVKYDEEEKHYHLEQIPEINGALVALDPHSGRVLAMVGGYDYSSPFNRAIQAKRQPGSAFKPFVYLTALLEKQFTPASIIVDAEIEFELGNETIWSPKNYSGKYYGPSTLRQGIERSRNAMTVRLAQIIGLSNVIKISELLGIYNNPPAHYSYVLGAVETNVLNLTNAYAMLVNGGKKITPTLIEVIQNNDGKIIYKRDTRTCNTCYISENTPSYAIQHVSSTPPILPDNRTQIIDPNTAYQMVSILEGVVKRGTGMKAKQLKRTLGGKTGTTNDSFDSWFIGFSPDMVVGVYSGFDQPKTLGKKETGASIALPIFVDFMEKALADTQDIPFRVPKDIQLVRIDKNTGLLPSPATKRRDIITEAFKIGTAPKIKGIKNNETGDYSPTQTIGTGGIY